MGAVSPGSLNASIFPQTEQLIYQILDYLDDKNQSIFEGHITLDIYEHIGVIDYPKNFDGEVKAMIHPQLQARDY
ncbi:MAG: hypothetical protein HRU34_18265 [Richelia sp.]|nr:hypothetical protein [Richelia sp.]CDN12173.1 aspartoacylase [Richelia intracellularis]